MKRCNRLHIFQRVLTRGVCSEHFVPVADTSYHFAHAEAVARELEHEPLPALLEELIAVRVILLVELHQFVLIGAARTEHSAYRVAG